MNQPEIDSYLRCEKFKERLAQADRIAHGLGGDRWAARIGWVLVTEGSLVAKRFAQRRSKYKESRAWACYCRLVDAGVAADGQQGFYDDPDDPAWANPMKWLLGILSIAAGEGIPEGFPRKR